MLWRHKFHDVINTMTSLFDITSFLLISLKTDIVNRNCQWENQKNTGNEIPASVSSKTTSRNRIKVVVAMATRKMAIAPPIFYREIKKFTQISTIVLTIILHQHFGFLLVQTKSNENHEFSHFFPEFIALSRKMNLTQSIRIMKNWKVS